MTAMVSVQNPHSWEIRPRTDNRIGWFFGVRNDGAGDSFHGRRTKSWNEWPVAIVFPGKSQVLNADRYFLVCFVCFCDPRT